MFKSSGRETEGCYVVQRDHSTTALIPMHSVQETNISSKLFSLAGFKRLAFSHARNSLYRPVRAIQEFWLEVKYIWTLGAKISSAWALVTFVLQGLR